MTTGQIYDLGYTPHEGERLGRSGAMRAITKDGIKRALGIGRKARSKIMPMGLILAAMTPAVVLVGIAFVFKSELNLDSTDLLGSHATYFDLISTLSLLFIALAAPAVMIPDRRDNVLAVYSSRPVSAADYLIARGGSLALLMLAFLVLPQLVLFVGLAALDPSGLFSAMVSDSGEVLRILAASVGYVVAFGVPAFLVAAYAKRTGMAAGMIIIGLTLLDGVAEALTHSDVPGASFAPLLGIGTLGGTVRDWVFDLSNRTFFQAGLPLWSAAASLLATTVIVAYVVLRRYRREL
ncbi:Aminobenzoyl-glutamate transport protein [hydrothermal vent metagenome]|uniref:Aminobenzoyl-glutamate transport protein n=1 Tax=hydrothermal vent metagenome TaxID=652676 RepID=A0A3B0SMP4_9ZZZZ